MSTWRSLSQEFSLVVWTIEMCGRYNLITDTEALLRFFEIQDNLYGAIVPRYNIAPSQTLPIVLETSQGRCLVPAKWGLVPFWSKEPKTKYSTINARAETLVKSATYREPFKYRRCLIPATGFYEWQKGPSGKQPWHVQPAHSELFAFAGLYDRWHAEQADELRSYTIITTEANPLVRPIHNRMPAVLQREDYPQWLSSDPVPAEALLALLDPCPNDWLRAYPVSSHVNSPQHDDPDCIAPLERKTPED